MKKGSICSSSHEDAPPPSLCINIIDKSWCFLLLHTIVCKHPYQPSNLHVCDFFMLLNFICCRCFQGNDCPPLKRPRTESPGDEQQQ